MAGKLARRGVAAAAAAVLVASYIALRSGPTRPDGQLRGAAIAILVLTAVVVGVWATVARRTRLLDGWEALFSRQWRGVIVAGVVLGVDLAFVISALLSLQSLPEATGSYCSGYHVTPAEAVRHQAVCHKTARLYATLGDDVERGLLFGIAAVVVIAEMDERNAMKTPSTTAGRG